MLSEGDLKHILSLNCCLVNISQVVSATGDGFADYGVLWRTMTRHSRRRELHGSLEPSDHVVLTKPKVRVSESAE